MYSDVDIVKSRTNIVDIVGEYVKLTKAGNNFKACCPFHQEKTPSFTVNEEKQMYHCFGCNQGGDVLSFVMEIESIGFREALELLAQKAGVELQKQSFGTKRTADYKKRMYDALDVAAQFYEKQLWDGVGKKQALPYIQSRGITDAIVKKFRLGFAPEGWNHIEQFLQNRGYDQKLAASVGMLIQNDRGGYYDRFRNRIMFPICDAMGRVIGFTARAMPGDDAQQAKYINTPESFLYHKSAVLYGIHHAKQAIKQHDRVVVVEGNMDVIAAMDAGVENVVAVSGTAMTDDHIRMLKRYTQNFTLFFDADDAGINAARRSAMACLEADINLSMVLLSHGKDAADIVKENPAELRDIIAQAQHVVLVFVDVAQKTFHMNDPHGKRQAIESVAEIIAHIAHDLEREEWVEKCAQIFDTKKQLVHAMVQKYRSEQSDRQPQQQNAPHAADTNHNISQTQRIYQSIILMTIAYPEVWKHMHTHHERYGPVMDQKQLQFLMREGPKCDFSAGRLIEQHPDKEGLYKAAMKMRQKYEIEHEDGGDPVQDVEVYIAIAQDTINKRKMDALLKRMRMAEENADIDEQQRILRDINQLSQKSISHS